MALFVYTLYGWTVASRRPLGTREPAVSAGAAPPDVRLEWGPPVAVPARAPGGNIIATAPHRDGSGNFLTAASQDDGYILRAHGVCDFHVAADLSAVRAVPAPGVPDDQVAVLFVGTVMAFVLALAGKPVLHASAVALPGEGGAVAIIGPPGTGKSTVTGLLSAAGGVFLTDDVVVIGFEDGRPTVVGGAYELRLRDNALHVLDAFDEPPPTRRTADGRTAVRLGRPASGEVPLVALVLPRPDRAGNELNMVEVPKKDSVRLLLGSARVPGWLLAPVLVEHFRTATRVAESVPLYSVRFPWSPAPSVLDAKTLLADLAGRSA